MQNTYALQEAVVHYRAGGNIAGWCRTERNKFLLYLLGAEVKTAQEYRSNNTAESSSGDRQ